MEMLAVLLYCILVTSTTLPIAERVCQRDVPASTLNTDAQTDAPASMDRQTLSRYDDLLFSTS